MIPFWTAVQGRIKEVKGGWADPPSDESDDTHQLEGHPPINYPDTLHRIFLTSTDLAAGGSDDMSYDHGSKLAFTIELRDQGRYGFLLPENQVSFLNCCFHQKPVYASNAEIRISSKKQTFLYPILCWPWAPFFVRFSDRTKKDFATETPTKKCPRCLYLYPNQYLGAQGFDHRLNFIIAIFLDSTKLWRNLCRYGRYCATCHGHLLDIYRNALYPRIKDKKKF